MFIRRITICVFLFGFHAMLLAQDRPRFVYQAGTFWPQSTNFSKNIGVWGDRPRAYVLNQGQLELSLHYQQVNGQLDLFDVKNELQEDTSINFLDFSGNVGDMQGLELLYNYGWTENFTLLTRLQRMGIEYGLSTVNVDRFHVAGRFQLLKPRANPQISLELRGNHLRGNGFETKVSEIRLNNISEISVGEKDSLLQEEIVIEFLEPKKMRFGGLASQGAELRILASLGFDENWYAHFFGGYGKSDVSSEIKFSFPGFQRFEELASRTQEHTLLGVAVDWQVYENIFLHASKEKRWFARSARIKKAPEINRLIRTELMYRFSQNWILSFQAQYFQHFFAGEIPFLLNEQTARIFEKPYGYLSLGLAYTADPLQKSRPRFVTR